MRKLLFALALMGCMDNNRTPGDDDGPGDGSGSGEPEVSAADRQRDYDDVAFSLGANVNVVDAIAMFDTMNIAYGRYPDGFTNTPGSNFFTLAGTRGSLSVSYKVYCRDVADLPTDCNGLEDHAHVHPTFKGSVAVSALSMGDILRTGHWIVRELTTPTPRVGGNGTNTFSSHLSTGDYVLTITDLVDRVRFSPVPTMPMSGGINWTIHVQRTRAGANPSVREFDVAARITFDGTDKANITLDSMQVYNLSMSTGAVSQ